MEQNYHVENNYPIKTTQDIGLIVEDLIRQSLKNVCEKNGINPTVNVECATEIANLLKRFIAYRVKNNLFNIERIYGFVKREEISLSKARNMVEELLNKEAT